MTIVTFLKRPLLNTVDPLGSISYLGYNKMIGAIRKKSQKQIPTKKQFDHETLKNTMRKLLTMKSKIQTGNHFSLVKIQHIHGISSKMS